MTTDVSSAPAAGPHGPAGPAGPVEPGPRRAYRDGDMRLLGGVASGLAEHLRVPVLRVRLGFLVAALVGGFGVAAYAGLWLFLPAAEHLERHAPGLEAAIRQGRRPRSRVRLHDIGPLAAWAAIAIGLLVLAQVVLGATVLFWPLLIGALGLAVLWRQADEAQRERWVDSTGRISPGRAVFGSGGAAAYARLATGAGLLLVALLLFALRAGSSGSLAVARDVVVAGVLGVTGLALVVGPWLFRLTGDLSEERSARLRSQERADVAAHLHDSVLQTLALIQRHAGDARTVGTLARAQERDLRSWLYADLPAAAVSVAGGLRSAAAEVEDAHGVPIEVIVVGDRPATDRTRALVLAAREAMTNAARHSGAERVDVYAECGGGSTEVFVRDRGCGFEEAAVPADRLGVRGSIRDRMRRHGGSAEVRTSPGGGTEVRLLVHDGAAGPAGPAGATGPAGPAGTAQAAP